MRSLATASQPPASRWTPAPPTTSAVEAAGIANSRKPAGERTPRYHENVTIRQPQQQLSRWLSAAKWASMKAFTMRCSSPEAMQLRHRSTDNSSPAPLPQRVQPRRSRPATPTSETKCIAAFYKEGAAEALCNGEASIPPTTHHEARRRVTFKLGDARRHAEANRLPRQVCASPLNWPACRYSSVGIWRFNREAPHGVRKARTLPTSRAVRSS